jgi:hypothetical protein
VQSDSLRGIKHQQQISINYTRKEWRRCEPTLETGGEDVNLHSKRVEKMWTYTRNGWRRCEPTLETSGEDVNLHSKRVEKMWTYTRNGWRRCETTLETGGEDVKLQLKRVKKMWNYTRNEWRKTRNIQCSSHGPKIQVRRNMFSKMNNRFSWKSHSKRVEKMQKDAKLHSKRLNKMRQSKRVERCGEDV